MVLGRDYIPVQISDHTFLFYLTSLPSEHQNCFCILLIWFIIQNSKFVSSSRKSNFFLSKNLYFYFFVQNFFPCCLDTSGSMIALWVPEISPWAVFVTDMQGELGICICICVCIFNCNLICISDEIEKPEFGFSRSTYPRPPPHSTTRWFSTSS